MTTSSHAEHISDLFSRIARRYDLMNRLMTFGQDQRWRRLAARRAALKPGELILDLGAGTGDLSLALRKTETPLQGSSARISTRSCCPVREGRD